MRKRLFSILVCIALLLSCALPALAEETPEEGQPETDLTISSIREFLEFAENCRLDSYSEGLRVSLERDLDLSGMDFQGVPIFSGTFDGQGHTISGLEMTQDGSYVGLFRYVTAGAAVQNLNVQGRLAPGGSRARVGGVAGSNGGILLNCTFRGYITGGEAVGGIAGENAVTGTIENASAEGTVYGTHFVGGIAGENRGVIRHCENRSLVNTTSQQNDIALSDITIESMTNSEAVNTVTDIGGIAGTSSGVIRDCTNHADVGYRRMGYNIGGIVGTQSGYVADCENQGAVYGRKEVGGIVGQMEPAALVEYDTDALQILEGQLNTMGRIVNQTSANMQSGAAEMGYWMEDLQNQVGNTSQVVDILLGENGNPSADSIWAAQNFLSDSMIEMYDSVEGLRSSAAGTVEGLSSDLYALQNQIHAMSATLGSVSDTLGGSIRDMSDLDTDLDLTGKADSCINTGAVLGDLNVGGIAGAMALENDLDPEDDWEISGSTSLNFESELRSVIKNCENTGTVTAKRQNVGGIVGWQSLGLVQQCCNTGRLDSEGAKFVGGISGRSTGFIREAYAKCELSGGSELGGIAGSASFVTDCRSMVRILAGTEKVGAILGIRETASSEEEMPIRGNLYLPVDADPGAIDGISYEGLAQPAQMAEFLALEELPELFRSVTITFRYADGHEKRLSVEPGGTLTAGQIPNVPEKEGYMGIWEGLAEAELTDIRFDMTFQAAYTGYTTVVQSDLDRNGQPILLLQGSFTDETALTLSQCADVPALSDGQTLLESWSLNLSRGKTVTTARYLLPEDAGDRLAVWVLDKDGIWQTREGTVDGSYLVFGMNPGETAFTVIRLQEPAWPYLAAGGAAVLLLLGAVLLKKKGKKKE